MSFHYYTPEQRYHANSIPIKEVMDQLGLAVQKSGKEWRYAGHQGLTFRNNVWYQHGTCEKGMTIDFLLKFLNYTYQEAMEFLINEFDYSVTVPKAAPIKKEFKIPKKAENNKRAWAYLCKTRLIDPEIVRFFMKKDFIYEEAKHHNVVFAGVDEDGKMQHASVRGTLPNVQFRGNVDGSEPQFSFHWYGSSDQCYVFEAPIDMLSYITLRPQNWQQHSYVALCGTSPIAVQFLLKQNKSIKNVCLCLDQDSAGYKAMDRISELLEDEFQLLPEMRLMEYKDWNESLKAEKGLTGQLANPLPNIKIPQCRGDSKTLCDLMNAYASFYGKNDPVIIERGLEQVTQMACSMLHTDNFPMIIPRDGKLDQRLNTIHQLINQIKTLSYTDNVNKELIEKKIMRLAVQCQTTHDFLMPPKTVQKVKEERMEMRYG